MITNDIKSHKNKHWTIDLAIKAIRVLSLVFSDGLTVTSSRISELKSQGCWFNTLKLLADYLQ